VLYLLVLVIAAAAGAAVAFSTLRTGTETVGNGPSAAWTRRYESSPDPTTEPHSPAVTGAHSGQPLPTDPTTHTKVVGAVGLAIAVLVAAGAIVGVFYIGVMAIKHATG
jgi:hypothetical protein